MEHLLTLQWVNQFSARVFSLLVIVFTESVVFFSIISCTVFIQKKLPSEIKHVLWFAVICLFIILPVVTIITPVINFEYLKVFDKRDIASEGFSSMYLTYSNVVEYARLSEEGTPVFYEINNQIRFHWSFYVLLVWITGAIISSLRFITGKIGLIFVTRKAQPVCSNNNTLLLKTLSRELGIKRDVTLFRSKTCNGPFTSSLLKPFILLPWDFNEWGASRKRVVLIHELAHISRRDYLTKFISRSVCVGLWFVPVVWIAYSNLQIEQEKACDAFVIKRGTEPADYADHLIGIVHFARRNFLLVNGVFITKIRKKVLEKRIFNMLYFRRFQSISRGKLAVLILIFCFGLLIASLTINPIIADNEAYVAKENEELYGTWINPDYDKFIFKARMINKPDGTYQAFLTLNSPLSVYSGIITIVDRWIDSKGDIWYKCTVDGARGDGCSCFYELHRISNSGSTWEFVFSSIDYPEKIDPDDVTLNYRIYYRE
jgi:beta-lactamase regulating signal transducer with metallopeptidase domain